MRVRCQQKEKLTITLEDGSKVEIYILKIGNKYARFGIVAPMDIKIVKYPEPPNAHNLEKK